MKLSKILWIAALCLALAACGKEQPAPAADDTAPADAVEEAVTEAADEVTDEAEEAQEVLEVVEESASEPEQTSEEAIVLAQAAGAPVRTDWKFTEGRHFARLVPTQRTVGGADKIEVAEFFWYGCPHCYTLEPVINSWAEDLPPNVRFVRVPGMWNNVLRTHAQLFYTEEVLVREGKITEPAAFRESVFEQYHRRGNRLLNPDVIEAHFARFGVSSEDFRKTWNSFEVNQKMRLADDLGRRYSIASVPMIVVNGKYRTSASEAGGYRELIELIDELIERESIR